MNLSEIQTLLEQYYPTVKWETPRRGVRYMIGKKNTMIITGSEIVIRPNNYGNKGGMADYGTTHFNFSSDEDLIPALKEFERREL